MDEILQTIAGNEAMIMGLALGPLALIAILLIVRMSCRVALENTRQREETRREIAAYLAEGSISGDEAERLLQPRPWYADSFCPKNWTSGAKNARGASGENV